jgi:hypothetical protein
VTEFVFPAELCQGCPLKEQCLRKHDKGRGVKVHRYETMLQKARAQQKTPEFQAKYEARPMVERANAELKRHGLRKARYLGRVKLDLQALWTASVLNPYSAPFGAGGCQFSRPVNNHHNQSAHCTLAQTVGDARAQRSKPSGLVLLQALTGGCGRV